MKTERKKTVTLIIGPKTEAALEKYCAAMQKENPGQLWTFTDVVGVAFRKWMRESIEVTHTIDLPKTWVSNTE